MQSSDTLDVTRLIDYTLSIKAIRVILFAVSFNVKLGIAIFHFSLTSLLPIMVSEAFQIGQSIDHTNKYLMMKMNILKSSRLAGSRPKATAEHYNWVNT